MVPPGFAPSATMHRPPGAEASLQMAESLAPAKNAATFSGGFGGAAIAPVVRALDEAGFAVEGIELVRPTLDDVFAEKTGHRLEGAEVATPDAEAEPEAPVPA